MAIAGLPRILLLAEQLEFVTETAQLLREARYEVEVQAYETRSLPLATCQMIVLEGCQDLAQALELCRRLRGLLLEGFTPILFVAMDSRPETRLAILEAGANAYLLRPFEPGELLAQLRAFTRIKEEHDRLHDQSAEVQRINRRLQQAYQQIDGELELARRIQRSFLPQELPEVAGVRFAACYLPRGRVGGDFYDVFRLDENHVGLYVADAVGHGVPAALLTIYVKKGVRAKEVFGNQYRLVPPAEVLQRLNRDLVEQALSDQPFITMAYALFDQRDRTLCLARAGHPYPVHIPHAGDPVLWELPGSLLGVFETTFPESRRSLQVGDKVLLYTDGVDAAQYSGLEPGTPSLMACVAQHRNRPIEDLIPLLARDLFHEKGQPDDLTLLGLEVV